jgi:hypothetical protein
LVAAYGDDEAIQLGVGLFEVRAGPGIEAANGDTTWSSSPAFTAFCKHFLDMSLCGFL